MLEAYCEYCHFTLFPNTCPCLFAVLAHGFACLLAQWRGAGGCWLATRWSRSGRHGQELIRVTGSHGKKFVEILKIRTASDLLDGFHRRRIVLNMRTDEQMGVRKAVFESPPRLMPHCDSTRRGDWLALVHRPSSINTTQ